MRKVKVTCDSTCDLSAELIEKYNITVLPLAVILGEKEYLDGVNVSAFDIFDFVKKNNILPKTAAVSVGQYRDAFKPYVDKGYDIVYDITVKCPHASRTRTSSHRNSATFIPWTV